MHVLDLEAMNVPKFPEFARAVLEYEVGGEFQIGMQFEDKKVADHVIRYYNMSRSMMYRVKELSPSTLQCKCVHFGLRCNWLIRGKLYGH